MEYIRYIFLDIQTVLYKDLLINRRLFLAILPILVTPVMVMVFQVAFVLYLAKSGDVGITLATSMIQPFKQGISSYFGYIVIVGAAGPLAAGTINRERYSGALEGILSTPITTFGIWFGKTIACWLPCAILYIISLMITITIVNTSLKDIGAYSSEEYLSAIRSVVLVLVNTFLITALLVQLQLGSSQRTSIVLMFGQIIVVIIALPIVCYRLINGNPINNKLVTIMGIVAIPAAVLLLFVISRLLISRENILRGITR